MIIALPDDATPAEIAEIVGDYYRPAKPQESPPSPEADLAETAPTPGFTHQTALKAQPTR
jgi:hypothetical protein